MPVFLKSKLEKSQRDLVAKQRILEAHESRMAQIKKHHEQTSLNETLRSRSHADLKGTKPLHMALHRSQMPSFSTKMTSYYQEKAKEFVRSSNSVDLKKSKPNQRVLRGGSYLTDRNPGSVAKQLLRVGF